MLYSLALEAHGGPRLECTKMLLEHPEQTFELLGQLYDCENPLPQCAAPELHGLRDCCDCFADPKPAICDGACKTFGERHPECAGAMMCGNICSAEQRALLPKKQAKCSWSSHTPDIFNQQPQQPTPGNHGPICANGQRCDVHTTCHGSDDSGYSCSGCPAPLVGNSAMDGGCHAPSEPPGTLATLFTLGHTVGTCTGTRPSTPLNVPQTITLSGCGGPNAWANDKWIRDGNSHNHPQWRRDGNNNDKLRWESGTWLICGTIAGGIPATTKAGCAQISSDAQLPPKDWGGGQCKLAFRTSRNDYTCPCEGEECCTGWDGCGQKPGCGLDTSCSNPVCDDDACGCSPAGQAAGCCQFDAPPPPCDCSSGLSHEQLATRDACDAKNTLANRCECAWTPPDTTKWVVWSVLLVMLLSTACTSAFCALCSRKQFKTAGGSLEKIDVEGVETGPSIYDASWAR